MELPYGYETFKVEHRERVDKAARGRPSRALRRGLQPMRRIRARLTGRRGLGLVFLRTGAVSDDTGPVRMGPQNDPGSAVSNGGMDKKPVHPLTKDAALQELGAGSKKKRAELVGEVELVRVAAGRQLLAPGSFMPTVLVGLRGSIKVSGDTTPVTHIDAPFVVDVWAADDRRISELSVVASSAATLVLVDWSARESVAAHAPVVSELSDATRAVLTAAAEDSVVMIEVAEPGGATRVEQPVLK